VAKNGSTANITLRQKSLLVTISNLLVEEGEELSPAT
jgi:hypothetical protein